MNTLQRLQAMLPWRAVVGDRVYWLELVPLPAGSYSWSKPCECRLVSVQLGRGTTAAAPHVHWRKPFDLAGPDAQGIVDTTELRMRTWLREVHGAVFYGPNESPSPSSTHPASVPPQVVCWLGDLYC